jgi:hypothetical protein
MNNKDEQNFMDMISQKYFENKIAKIMELPEFLLTFEKYNQTPEPPVNNFKYVEIDFSDEKAN